MMAIQITVSLNYYFLKKKGEKVLKTKGERRHTKYNIFKEVKKLKQEVKPGKILYLLYILSNVKSLQSIGKLEKKKDIIFFQENKKGIDFNLVLSTQYFMLFSHAVTFSDS